MKPLIFLVTMAVSFSVGAVAYHYSKLNNSKLLPFYSGAIAWAITVFLAMLVIIILDRLGLYVD